MATRRTTRDAIPGAAAFLPPTLTLPVLQRAVQDCRGCDLYRHATQAVFGEQSDTSAHVHANVPRMMMIGEQPGDREDREGHPFVGPAGKLLDRCLHDAGIDRTQVYVTNAVKHFKWEPRGKLRIHKKPSAGEIFACRPWLDAEVKAVQPALLVCLGATAAQALLGSRFKVTESRGSIQHAGNLPPIIASFHPASILRAVRHEDRERQTDALLTDLLTARHFLQKLSR